MPSPQLETVNVRVAPALAEAAEIAKLHPVAVPELEKSAFATPVTPSLNCKLNVMSEAVVVGVVCDDVKSVGVGTLRYVIATEPLPFAAKRDVFVEVAPATMYEPPPPPPAHWL